MVSFNSIICFFVLIAIFEQFNWINAAKKRADQHADVLILGAGIAGVTAAKTLFDNGIYNVLILEGTDRVGGRIQEATVGKTTVQTGASWITGSTGNPMFELLLANNINWVESDYDDWLVFDDNGTDVTSHANKKSKKMTKAYNFAEDIRKHYLNISDHPDYTISSTMALGGWIPKDAIDDVVEYFEVDFMTAMPGDLSSVMYMHGTNPVFPYKYQDLYVVNEREGYL